MEELEKVFLDSKADEFILENFWAARSIEKEMKDFYLKSNRTVWTMLPKGLDEKSIIGFPWSHMNGDVSSRFEYEKILLDILNENISNEWIAFDNVSETNEDPKKLSAEVENLTKVFFYNQTVLHWLPKELVNLENLEKAMNIGFYPTFGILTAITERIKENILNNKVTAEDITFMINNIKYMAMGAYDEEGCLSVEINNS